MAMDIDNARMLGHESEGSRWIQITAFVLDTGRRWDGEKENGTGAGEFVGEGARLRGPQMTETKSQGQSRKQKCHWEGVYESMGVTGWK